MEDTKKIVDESSKYFHSSYQEMIFYQFYARWQDDLGRRETWVEAIDRYMTYMKGKVGDALSNSEYSEIREALLNQEICPSMRLLWSAGDACDATNVTAYNCAYVAPTSWKDLSEIMYVSMCGAGCGFAVEKENVSKFPVIKEQTGEKLDTIIVDDSRDGWCEAFLMAATAWAEGKDVEIDYSMVRPAGARLMTMGGRASGPQPLIDLMNFTRDKMLAAQGRQLTPLELHDIICQIGLIVVAGGVRRSALISLSELKDVDMRDAKAGEFWENNGQRSMANNSAVYEAKPSAADFLEEWTALVKSGTGERGIFNRGELEKQVPDRRWQKLKDQEQVGVNPCGEIYLRSKQFCNLTSIVVRPDDNLEDLKRKMRLATLLGTYQATLTDFGYLGEEWKKNCEEEQLLGVSITGYFDNELIRNDDVLDELREESIEANKEYSSRFGSNQSTAITCVKPHGNSGQLLYVGSGMHPWFAKHYIRRVRISVNDPLMKMIQDQGIPVVPEVGYSTSTTSTMVMEFPIKAPEGALTNKDVTALDMLAEWKRLKEHFTEHNPSVTIYAGDEEWLDIANFVYKNWDQVGGLSFLPRSEHVYQLAPYEEITEEEYNERKAAFKDIDFSKLSDYEKEDQTVGAKELACVGGNCEV
jgi:ribonucleoside-triphosphate reductase